MGVGNVLEVRYIILWMFLVSALRQICISPMLFIWKSHFNAKVIRSNLKRSCYCYQIKILDFLNALWLVQSVSLFCKFCTLPWLYIENPRLVSQVSKRCNPMPPIFMVMISLERLLLSSSNSLCSLSSQEILEVL